MFGPESGKHGWNGLPFVYENVRISEGEQAQKCAQFLSIFEKEVDTLISYLILILWLSAHHKITLKLPFGSFVQGNYVPTSIKIESR